MNNLPKKFVVDQIAMDAKHEDIITALEEFRVLLFGSEIESNTSSEGIVVLDMFSKVQESIEKHFLFEEKLMKELLYPFFDEHKKSHDASRNLIVSFKQNFTSLAVLELIKEMCCHMADFDKKFSDYYKL